MFQLLDCFTIPTVLALSCFFLRVRYKWLHLVGVFVCLLGVGALILADVFVNKHDSEGNRLINKLQYFLLNIKLKNLFLLKIRVYNKKKILIGHIKISCLFAIHQTLHHGHVRIKRSENCSAKQNVPSFKNVVC